MPAPGLADGFAPGIGARIRLLADRVGSRGKAARAARVSEDMVYRYMREDSLPSFGAMANLAHAAGASLEWLATGDGSMLLDGVGSGSEFVAVPRYDVGAGGGSSSKVAKRQHGVGACAFRRDWLHRQGLIADELAVIQIMGDSMSPTIRDGALGLVDRSQQRAGKDGVYILLLKNHLVAKRLQADFSGGIYIRSDNPAYREQHLTPEQAANLDIFGRVIWVGSKI